MESTMRTRNLAVMSFAGVALIVATSAAPAGEAARSAPAGQAAAAQAGPGGQGQNQAQEPGARGRGQAAGQAAGQGRGGRAGGARGGGAFAPPAITWPAPALPDGPIAIQSAVAEHRNLRLTVTKGLS